MKGDYGDCALPLRRARHPRETARHLASHRPAHLNADLAFEAPRAPAVDWLSRGAAMAVLDEVLTANAAYAESFGDKGEAGPAAGPALRHPDLHGCPAGSGQVRRAGRRRRARDPQRRRPRQRRRDPLAGHLVQAARHAASGSSSTTPTAAWSSSPTRSCAACWPAAWRRRRSGPMGGTTSARVRVRRRANFIDWLTINDQAGSVVEDVERIRQHPLVPANIPIYGYIYDVKSGRLIEVPTATEAGRASAENHPLSGAFHRRVECSPSRCHERL